MLNIDPPAFKSLKKETERTDLNGSGEAEALIGVESPAVSSEGAPPIGARPGTSKE